MDGNGSNWGEAFKTLSKALQEANNGDVITAVLLSAVPDEGTTSALNTALASLLRDYGRHVAEVVFTRHLSGGPGANSGISSDRFMPQEN